MMGGVVLRRILWFGSKAKQRKVDVRVNVDLSNLPGPLGFWGGLWFRFMVVSLLAPMLLPGRTVWVCCVNSPHFTTLAC